MSSDIALSITSFGLIVGLVAAGAMAMGFDLAAQKIAGGIYDLF